MASIGAMPKLFGLPFIPPTPDRGPVESKDKEPPSLTEDEFSRKVLKSDRKVLVMFSAAWCKQCQPLKEVVGDVGRIFRGGMDVYQMDYDRMTEQFREKWDTEGILPLVLLLNGGHLADRLFGSSPLTDEEERSGRFSPPSLGKNRKRLLRRIETRLGIKPPGDHSQQ